MKFPLIDSLGLHIIYGHSGRYIYCEDLEELLKAAPVVYANEADIWTNFHSSSDTHTARLIGITEIKRDTAESLLREFTKSLVNIQEHNDLRDLVDRAKKLLEGK